MKKALKWGFWIFAVVMSLFSLIIIRLVALEWNQNDKTALIQMDSLGERLEKFKASCGRYPLTDEGLNFLVNEVTNDICGHFPQGGFIEGGHLPLDPWDKEYQYLSDGYTYSIFTQNDGKRLLKISQEKAKELE